MNKQKKAPLKVPTMDQSIQVPLSQDPKQKKAQEVLPLKTKPKRTRKRSAPLMPKPPIQERMNKPLSELLDPNYSLFPHQQTAMRFMAHREQQSHFGIRGGFLVMEMGLGKTLTAIAHSLRTPRHPVHTRHGQYGFPTLVICSKTVLVSWKMDAFEKFFGDRVKVLYLHPSYIGVNINRITRKELVHYDFVVTTYDIVGSASKKRPEIIESVLIRAAGIKATRVNNLGVRTQSPWVTNHYDWKGREILFGTPWERIIADESQVFCNPKTHRYRSMMALWSKYKWCLTGTPIKNNPVDLWSQLRFCGYEGTKYYHEWRTWTMRDHKLNDCILEMSFQSLNITMPDITTHNVVVDMSEPELKIYEDIRTQVTALYENVIGGVNTMSSVFAQMVRMRLSCIAPSLMVRNKPYVDELGSTVRSLSEYVYALVPGATKKKLAPYFKMAIERRINERRPWVYQYYGQAGINSSKIMEVLRILTQVRQRGEKVIVFSSFRCALDIVTDSIYTNAPEIGYVQIDGTVAQKRREDILREFKEDSDKTVLFLTYKVGAEGINVTCANNIVFLEPWWTPSTFQQGIARIWRTGQKKCVSVYYMIMRGTIEERIIKICQRKTNMSNMMLSKGMSMDLIRHLLIEPDE